MTRTVYLFENEEIQIRVDGPSMLIENKNKASQRIPLDLISKVYLIGNIYIKSEILIALAENGIPLILSRLTGEKKAVLLPFNHKLPKYHKLQRVKLENSSNLNKYLDWVEIYRHYIQLKVLRRFVPSLSRVNSIGEGDYNQYLMRLKPVDDGLWKAVNRPIGGFLIGLIVEKLTNAKLDMHIGGYFRRVSCGLVLDLFYILEPLADEQSVMFFKQRDYIKYFDHGENEPLLNNDGCRNIVQRFENKNQEVQDYIDKIIDDYFFLLRELNT